MVINAEDLISSLLFIGNDKVDSTLFSRALAKITGDSKFKFTDYTISKFFASHIEFNGLFFKLKEGLSLNAESSLNMILNRNTELTSYLISNGFGFPRKEISNKPKRALVKN